MLETIPIVLLMYSSFMYLVLWEIWENNYIIMHTVIAHNVIIIGVSCASSASKPFGVWMSDRFLQSDKFGSNGAI